MLKLTRRALPAVAAAVFALSVAALPRPSFAADPVTLKVGYIPILAAAPLFVLDAEGWVKDAGVKLELIRFEAGTAAIQALAGGQADILYAGVAPTLVARSKGVDVSVIANSAVEELALVARGDLAATAAKAGSAEAVRQFAAKEGRKVKIGAQPAGSVPDIVLKHWIYKVAKLDPAIIEIVPMGIEKTQQALLAGALDAAMIREPTITIVRRTDPGASVLALGGEMFPAQPGTVVAAAGAAIRDKTDAVQALITAHRRAVALVQADPARAARLSNEYLGKGLLEPAVLEEALKSPSSKYVDDPRLVIEPSERLQAFQVEIGLSAAPIPVRDAFDLRFFDKAAGK
jgi:NitT/TauT family transport system substrate-binding protein